MATQDTAPSDEAPDQNPLMKKIKKLSDWEPDQALIDQHMAAGSDGTAAEWRRALGIKEGPNG